MVGALHQECQPPPELRLAWMCGEQFLPAAGGVMDQDYRQLKLMRLAKNIYETLDRMQNLHGTQIHSMTTGERRLVRWLRESGYYG